MVVVVAAVFVVAVVGTVEAMAAELEMMNESTTCTVLSRHLHPTQPICCINPRPIKTKNLTAHHGSHSNSNNNNNNSYNYCYNYRYKGMAQYINCSMDAAADRARRAPCGAYAIHTLVVALL